MPKWYVYVAMTLVALAFGARGVLAAPAANVVLTASAPQTANSAWNISGKIESMNGQFWYVHGFSIRVDSTTSVSGGVPTVGSTITAEGVVQPDGTWLAVTVRVEDDRDPSPTATSTPNPSSTPTVTPTNSPVATLSPTITTTAVTTVTATATPTPKATSDDSRDRPDGTETPKGGDDREGRTAVSHGDKAKSKTDDRRQEPPGQADQGKKVGHDRENGKQGGSGD